MKDHLENSRYSVGHAKRRIAEFQREFDAFVESESIVIVTESDLDAAQDVHKLKLVKPMPVPLKGTAFDVVSNLRAALDHAGYAIAIADGKKGDDAHFPFGINAQSRRSLNRGRSVDIRREIFDVMFAFEPYEGGNDVLFALNRLCNTHKHEVVVPTALASGAFKVTKFDGRFSLIRSPWDRVKNEMEFARTEIGKELSGEFQFEIAIVFGDIDFVRGEPVLKVLCAICEEVERVLEAIEAEALRIGIFK